MIRFLLAVAAMLGIPAIASAEEPIELSGPPQPGAMFGHDVALTNGLAVVGAPGTSGGDGAVFVYELRDDGVWEETASFRGTEESEAQLGSSVSVVEGRIVASAPATGEVFVYTTGEDGWSETASISGASGFGHDVSMDGQQLAVASRWETGGGRVDVFQLTQDEWLSVAAFDRSETDSRFGASVAIIGEMLVVGDPGNSDPNGSALFVYQATSAGWGPVDRIERADGFGRMVGTDGDRIVATSDSGLTILAPRVDGAWVPDGPAGLIAGPIAKTGGLSVNSSGIAIGATPFSPSPPVRSYVDFVRFGDGSAADQQGTVRGGPSFGHAVAITDSWLMVGEPERDGLTGGVLLFPFDEVSASGEPASLSQVNPAYVEVSQGQWSFGQPGLLGHSEPIWFGDPGDTPLLGDWDCDGLDTPGMFRRSSGLVYLQNKLSTGAAETTFFLGLPGDDPLVGDWNGDGCDTLAVYRNGEVLFRNSLSTGVADSSFYFGEPTDVPLAGDWDGDGNTDIGAYRPSSGFVYLRHSLTTGVAEVEFFFGSPSDRPLVADWDGDGDDNVGVYRSSVRRVFATYEHETRSADEVFEVSGAGTPIAGRLTNLPFAVPFASIPLGQNPAYYTPFVIDTGTELVIWDRWWWGLLDGEGWVTVQRGDEVLQTGPNSGTGSVLAQDPADGTITIIQSDGSVVATITQSQLNNRAKEIQAEFLIG